jgi:hypothetical protein
LLAAWSQGSSVPELADTRCEGIADFAAAGPVYGRLPFFTAGLASELIDQRAADSDDLAALGEPQEMIYDGANAYVRVA